MPRPGFEKHPKFQSLALDLGSPVLALGHLVFLWESGYENGDPSFPNGRAVELAARWSGPRGQLLKFLLEAGGADSEEDYKEHPGYIEPDPDRPGGYLIHDFFDHAPRPVAKRAQREAERVAKGLTLSEIRRQSGKLGNAALAAKKANGEHLPGKRTASGQSLPATEQQVAHTTAPAPAPAPAPRQEEEKEESSPPAPLAEQGSAQLSLLPASKKLRARRPPGTFDPAAYPFPDPRMDAHPTFRSVWGRWCADRAKRKKPLTEEACRLQLAKLATWGSVAAVASIERSLECGWVGLFPPPDDEPKTPKARPVRNEGVGMFGGGAGLAPTPQGQGGDDFDLTGGPA